MQARVDLEQPSALAPHAALALARGVELPRCLHAECLAVDEVEVGRRQRSAELFCELCLKRSFCLLPFSTALTGYCTGSSGQSSLCGVGLAINTPKAMAAAIEATITAEMCCQI